MAWLRVSKIFFRQTKLIKDLKKDNKVWTFRISATKPNTTKSEKKKQTKCKWTKKENPQTKTRLGSIINTHSANYTTFTMNAQT